MKTTKVLLTAITVLAVSTLAASSSFAAGRKMKSEDKGKLGPAGCGLGYAVLGGKDLQILAATLNGTSANQTFGITTGTLDCDEGGRDTAVLTYIQNNKVALEKDIARGQGQTIGALAQITGCANEGELSTALKGHYSEIFPTAEPAAAEITDSIKHVIHNNTDLMATCAPWS